MSSEIMVPILTIVVTFIIGWLTEEQRKAINGYVVRAFGVLFGRCLWLVIKYTAIIYYWGLPFVVIPYSTFREEPPIWPEIVFFVVFVNYYGFALFKFYHGFRGDTNISSLYRDIKYHKILLETKERQLELHAERLVRLEQAFDELLKEQNCKRNSHN